MAPRSHNCEPSTRIMESSFMALALLYLLFCNSVVQANKILTRTKGASSSLLPTVINTWPFTGSTNKGWETIVEGGSALDAVETGITVCELKPCGRIPHKPSVGFGGSPDELGETTLDAMIMDGVTHNVGAVGCLKRVKNAIGVARSVMEHTKETFLVGEDATRFALQMGFPEHDLHTKSSIKEWRKWKARNCQPNSWQNVTPDPKKYCGPYKAKKSSNKMTRKIKNTDADNEVSEDNHDTIGMVTVDVKGNVAAGVSTNGLDFKVVGRVGDSSIAGAGAFADNEVGASAATGNGDIMMRFLPTYQAVQYMWQGKSPSEATRLALAKIVKYYPKFYGSLIAVNKTGHYGAASYGWKVFKYSVRNPKLGRVTVIPVKPFT